MNFLKSKASTEVFTSCDTIDLHHLAASQARAYVHLMTYKAAAKQQNSIHIHQRPRVGEEEASQNPPMSSLEART